MYRIICEHIIGKNDGPLHRIYRWLRIGMGRKMEFEGVRMKSILFFQHKCTSSICPCTPSDGLSVASLLNIISLYLGVWEITNWEVATDFTLYGVRERESDCALRNSPRPDWASIWRWTMLMVLLGQFLGKLVSLTYLGDFQLVTNVVSWFHINNIILTQAFYSNAQLHQYLLFRVKKLVRIEIGIFHRHPWWGMDKIKLLSFKYRSPTKTR